MIKTLQGDFQDKINAKEIEINKVRNGKNKNNNQEENNKQLKALKYHFEKLELVLRSIENDYTTLEQIWSLHDALESYLNSEDSNDFDQEIEQRYKEMNLPNKSLLNFPMLSEEDQELQKKVSAKKPEVKPVSVTTKQETKPVEKG